MKEIELKKRLTNRLDELKNDEYHCSECGMPLSTDDYITEYNRVPYGDSYADEELVSGYECHSCGYKEEY